MGLEVRTHSRTTLGIDGSLGKPCPRFSVIGSEIKFDVLETARIIEQSRSKEGRDAGWDNLKGRDACDRDDDQVKLRYEGPQLLQSPGKDLIP